MTATQPWIAVTGPQVPCGLLRARGFMPVTVTPKTSARHSPTAGVCAAALGWVDALLTAESQFAAAVLTTRCDQLRRTAEGLGERTRLPIFLMNIPVTRGTDASRQLYRDEVSRLDAFLERLAGAARVAPEPVRSDAGNVPAEHGRDAHATRDAFDDARLPSVRVDNSGHGCHRVGLLGCCLTEADDAVLHMLREVGLQIAANATESPLDDAEKRLTASLQTEDDARSSVCSVPVRASWDSVCDLRPTISQRPNAPFFEWLRQLGQASQLQGWVLLRQPWCDLFHAEVVRLKSETELPCLDLETGASPAVEALRTRAEAFVETLEARRKQARGMSGEACG